MKSLNFTRNIFSILVLAFTFLLVGSVEGQVVISQVYGGGNNSGATYRYDWIELFNKGNYSQNLNGWSIQYTSATGSATWSVVALNSLTLNPGQYYLIQLAGGTTNGINLPISVDQTSTLINLSGTAGKVALCNSTTALSGQYSTGTATSIVDFVGFGATANGFEGSGSAPAPNNTSWLLRSDNGYSDSNNNSADFVVSNSPTFRNSSNFAAPQIQTSNITLNSVTANSMNIGWTSGSGANRLVFMKNGSGTITNPVNNTNYTASSDWNSQGSQLGSSGYFCVYKGAGSSVTITNLPSATSFTIQIFEFNGSIANSILSYLSASSANNPSSQSTNCIASTWIGSSSGNWNTASNWCGGIPTSGSNLTIPSGTTVTLDGANEVIVGNLTINATGSLILPSSAKLTVNGTLTNNGTMTIENGASLVQGASSTLASGTTGTFNVKQFVTGAGGSTPTGRFWYMGLPISNLSRGTAFGAASGANRLWSWTEGTGWSLQLTDNTPLNPTTGYVFRTGSDVTLNFSGTSLYSANMNPTNLSNNGGPLGGCHLLSNPYTAYLDWAQVVDQLNTGTSNISTTYCVRSYNSTNNEMVYDTYNASGGVASNPSSLAVTQFIAPLQAFWIRVNTGFTGNVNITKSMLSHQSSGIGLKDITSFTAFARLNLVSGNFFDQVVVYTDANAGIEVEEYDSEKFFLPNKPQVYCKVGEKKLVINALKSGKAQNAVPLTIELPSTQVYKFEMAESFVENGLVILEDRQEGIFQDMGVNPTYEFYGNSGVVADRFILHFQLPNGTNNEGQAGLEDLTSAQIDVISNQQGEILVSLSSDLTATGDIQILDAAGRLIQTTAIKGQDTKLQITEGTGVYFVRVTTPMKSETKKVLVY